MKLCDDLIVWPNHIILEFLLEYRWTGEISLFWNILRNISLPQGFRAGMALYSRRYTRILVTGKTLLRLGASSELPNSSKVLTPGILLPTLSVFCLLRSDFWRILSDFSQFWSSAGPPRGYRCPYIPNYAGIFS